MTEDTLSLLTEALDRSKHAGTVRMEGAIQPRSVDGSPDIEMTFNGVADLRDQRALLTMQVVSDEVDEAQPPVVVLHDGQMVALKVDDDWEEMPVGTGGIDPLGVLDLLGGAVAATEANGGSGSAEGRHLDVVLDVQTAISSARDPGSLERWVSDVELSGEVLAAVWISADGHIERTVVDLPAPVSTEAEPVTTRIDIRYDDHGEPVAIPQRPPSEPGRG